MELGVMVSIYEETDIPAAFWYATEAGFHRGQVTSFIHGITAGEVREMGVAARNAGFPCRCRRLLYEPAAAGRPQSARGRRPGLADPGRKHGHDERGRAPGLLERDARQDADRAEPAERRRRDF